MSSEHKFGGVNNRAFGTIAIHAGQEPDPVFGSVMTPIYQTSTYVQKAPGECVTDNEYSNSQKHTRTYDYARAANPTRTALEHNLAALEGAKFGICYSSGLAATGAVIHLLKAGDHVLLCDDVYGGTFRIFDKVYKEFGITYSRVDMSDLRATEAGFQPNTKLMFLESPTNPLLKILDLEALAKLAHKKGALAVVDNTFASPYLQQPFELGADIVVHSTTKYIGGHSDLIGGVVLVNDEAIDQRLRFTQLAVGAVPGVWECFLALRSTKTLHVRMDRHSENGRAVAEFLEKHPKISKVLYPGLPSHPQHALAKKQMRDFGGMVTMFLKGDLDDARRFLSRCKVFVLAESLGGVESLLDHPATMTHASLTPEIRRSLGIDDGLIRLSVGIEDKDDLIEDLRQALA